MADTSFEDILAKAGDLGRWQLFLYAFIGFSGFLMGFQHLGSVFLAATPDHWCSVPGLDAGWADNPDLKDLVVPREFRHGKSVYSQCEYYDRNYTSLLPDNNYYNSSNNFMNLNRRNISILFNTTNITDPATVACNVWEYNRTGFTSTIVTEWNLVCQYKPLMSTVQALYMGGVLIGCLLYGCISDRWGRKRAVVTAHLHFCTATIAASFSPNLPVFLLCRFLIGVSAPGIFACPFVLVTELVGLKWRAILGICYQIPFGIGYATLPGLAYFVREWNRLQLAMSLPALILLSSFWILPESPRWLITKNRFPEALNILKRCARVNGRELPPDDEVIAMMKHIREENSTTKELSKRTVLRKLLGSRELLKRTFVGFYTWIVVALVYYGLAFESPSIGGNIYLMVFLGGILEIPAYLLGFLLVHVFGRRILYSITFLLAAATSFAILTVPSNITWLSPALAVGGKFFITITFAISYLYTAELFPTVVRNLAVNIGSMGGRIGSITAPYIVYDLGYYHYVIPLVVFGCLATTAGLLALLLPETKQANLSESITDVNRVTDRTAKRKEPSPAINGGKKYEEIPLESPMD